MSGNWRPFCLELNVLTSYWERWRDDSLMLAKIGDDTWDMLNMWHIIPNSKKWDYSDIPVLLLDKIKGPAI